MRLRFPRIAWLVGFLVCCTMACNLLDELEGPGEAQVEQDKQQAEYEKGWRITQTYLHTTPEFLWSDKPRATVHFEYTLTQQEVSKNCYWEYNEPSSVESEIRSGNTPKGATAAREGDTILLTFPHSGAFGCPEQVLQTTHSWTTLPAKLTPGEPFISSLTAAWSLKGSKECSTLMAGVKTEIITPKTRGSALRSGIILSKESVGSVQNTVTWVIPGHTFENDMMKIRVQATTGDIGYFVEYDYIYRCYKR